MPAELLHSKKRFLSIDSGRLKERIDETNTKEYNHLSAVHLVDVTFRVIEKEKEGKKEYIGEVLQLHCVDFTDYFIVETWANSAYARGFYQVMKSIDVTIPLTLITTENFKEGKKKAALFVKQNASILKWTYTRGNMQDCPPIEVEKVGDSIVYNDTMQRLFFQTQIQDCLTPALQKKVNPFPQHPIYTQVQILDDLPF